MGKSVMLIAWIVFDFEYQELNIKPLGIPSFFMFQARFVAPDASAVAGLVLLLLLVSLGYDLDMLIRLLNWTTREI